MINVRKFGLTDQPNNKPLYTCINQVNLIEINYVQDALCLLLQKKIKLHTNFTGVQPNSICKYSI